MSGIVTIDLQNPGGFAPLLRGASADPFLGTPVYLGYQMDEVAFAALAADCVEEGVFLRWLAVDAPCRNRGYGRFLVKTLCDFAARAGAKWVQAYLSSADADTAARMGTLLRNCDFWQLESSYAYRFSLCALENSPYAAFLAMSDTHIMPLRELSVYQIRAFNQRMMQLGEARNRVIDPEELLLEESMAWVEGGEIKGCVLLAQCAADLELRWVYCQNPKVMPALLGTAYQAVRLHYPPETVLHVAALHPAVQPLLEKFAGADLQVELEIQHFGRRV